MARIQPGESPGARTKVADKAIEKLKDAVRELTRRTRGHRLIDIVQELKTALTGWKPLHPIRGSRTSRPLSAGVNGNVKRRHFLPSLSAT